MVNAGADDEKAAQARRDAATLELKGLVVRKYRKISPVALSECKVLIRQTGRLGRHFPAQSPEVVLEAILEEILEHEREKLTPNDYLLAGGEFIGLRDERMPDDPPVPPYEVASDYETRLRRGGRLLPGRVATARNVRENHLQPGLDELPPAIDRFIARDDAADLVRARLARPHTRPESADTAPGNQVELTKSSPVALDEEPPSTDEVDHLVRSRSQYVRRPHYHDQFNRLVDGGERLIALVGEPGNGKSRLACELVAAKLKPAQTCINLPAGDIAALMSCIAGALSSDDIATYQMNNHELERAFAAHICSANAPDYVVIDDVADTELIHRLVPPMARSIVVVTSREDPLPPGQGVSVEIGEMSSVEAADFARQLLPNATPDDIEGLIGRLGNRPLAIEHVTRGLLYDGAMTMGEFNAAFDADSAWVMGQSRNSARETYTFIYEEIVAMIERSDVKASWLLRFIAFLASEDIPIAILGAALEIASPPHREEFGPVELSSALRRLESKYLVKSNQSGLSIHSFTQAILRSIFQEQATEICLHLHEVIRRGSESWRVGETTVRSASFLSHLVGIVCGLERASVDEWLGTDLGKTVAILLRSLRRSGNALLLWKLDSVIERAASSEMMAIRADRSWQEGNREWIAILDGMGELDRADRYSIVAAYGRNVSEDRRDDWSRLREFVSTIRIAAEMGERSIVLELLNEIRQSGELPEFFAAEVACLEGEIYTAHGKWTKAEARLRDAIVRYIDVDDQSGIGLVGQAHARKCLVDLLLMSRPFDRDTFSFSVIEQWQKLANSSTARNVELVQGHLWHASARLAAAHIGYLYGANLIDNAAQETVTVGAMGDEYDKIATTFIVSVELATRFYVAHSSIRLASDLIYDVTMLAPFIESDAGSQFTNSCLAIEYAAQSDNELSWLLFELAKMKICVLQNNVSPYLVVQLKALAYKFAYRYEFAYWYGESLVTACVAAVLNRAEYHDMREPLNEVLSELDRLDRWEELLSAIQVYETSGDFGAFLREFPHLLSY